MSELWYFIFNFFLYGFIGWMIEEVYCLVMTGHFQEDGFLYGPFKPMYAIAMSVLIFLYDKISLPVAFFLIPCAIVPTAVEYLSGLFTRHVFHKDYWNYYGLKFNFQGLICLQFSIYWTLLTFVSVVYVQPFIRLFYEQHLALWLMIAPVLLIGLLIDEIVTVYSFRR